VAKQQGAQSATDLATAYKSFFFDLPLAGLKWSLGAGEEKTATEAVWKGYDAGVRMTSTAIDTLYRNPLFSTIFGRTLSTALQWQQVGNAVSGAVFTSLWKALGAPTAAEIKGLSEQVRALDARLSQVAQKKEVQTILEQVRALDARLHRSAPTPLRVHHEERVAA
jgi:hypothetical protein